MVLRSIALAVLAPATALLGSVILANPAYACTTSHHFIGAYGITEPANTLFATQVEMTTDAAKQNCQSSSVWPMLYAGSNPDTEFAQIGLLQENGQTQQYVFYEYATTTSYILPQELFVAPSGKYANKVVYNGSRSQWYFYWNGTAEAGTNALGWAPVSAEYFGEVWATQDYVPGSPAVPENVSQIQYRNSGTTWYSYTSGQLGYSNGTNYGRFSAKNTDSFGIYDSRA